MKFIQMAHILVQENKEVLDEVEGVFMKKEQNTLKLDALYVSIQKDGS